MTYNSGIKYSDPIDDGTNGKYDGVPIKPDRKGGWNVTHEKLGYWIRAQICSLFGPQAFGKAVVRP